MAIRRRASGAVLGALASAVALGCWATEPREAAVAERPRSLLLLALDTTRADHLEPELGWSDEATAAYERALAADSGHWPASHNLGLARLRAGEPAASAAAFEAVLERRPDHVDPHFQLTLLYAGLLADPHRSLHHLEACFDHAPDHPRAPQLAELRGRLRTVLSGSDGD